MESTEFDLLDAAVARLEGPEVAAISGWGRALRPDGTPYQPTRQCEEAARLMEKYVCRLIKLNGRWAAVGCDGRAHVGLTFPVAVCKAVAAIEEPVRVSVLPAR